MTPGIAPVTVLEALDTASPSTVRTAFAPAWFAWKAMAVLVVVSVSELERVMAPAVPLVLLVRERRDPLASVTMLAVTPTAAVLIAAAKVESVSLVPLTTLIW